VATGHMRQRNFGPAAASRMATLRWCVAADGDNILTFNPGDLRVLAEVAEIRVDLISV
jgi:hypothetical protein